MSESKPGMAAAKELQKVDKTPATLPSVDRGKGKKGTTFVPYSVHTFL